MYGWMEWDGNGEEPVRPFLKGIFLNWAMDGLYYKY
jgi:hypothetical protein